MASHQQTVLTGIRVLDWTTMAAGPGATAVLADFGATVIKVEPPKGDPWRKVLLNQQQSRQQRYSAKKHRSFGSVFEHDNRGKRSIAVDLSRPAGVRAFHAILASCDVLVTNVRMAGTQRLKLDYESLRQEYPKLIYAHVTAWGRSGPMRDAPGYDAGAFWAATGMLDILAGQNTGNAGTHNDSELPVNDCNADRAAAVRAGLPPPLPGAAGDHSTSMALVAGIALALFNRSRSGEGKLVDVSLLRAGLWANSMFLSFASATPPSVASQVLRNPHRIGPTFRAYRCRDGETIHLLGYQTNRHTPSLLRALRRDALPVSSAEMNELFLELPASEWEKRFDKEGVWYTRIARIDRPDDLLGLPETHFATNSTLHSNNAQSAYRGNMSRVAEQVQATQGFLRGSHLLKGAVLISSPLDLNEGLRVAAHVDQASPAPRQAPLAPDIGEHTAEIMAEAGISVTEFRKLQDAGAFGAPTSTSTQISSDPTARSGRAKL
eukprot:INCI12304.1.p1 GENE.INCI12304.1~~INCI12304.1.p1  ORF type:complete len:492 (+),score=53.10 INCI12304.1:199-1674(+)